MKTQRFYALDLLRTCAIIVVTFYHVWESSFGQDKMLFSAGQSVFGLLTPFFLNYWGYSGLILAIISFFLIGYSAKLINWQRLALVSIGLVGMMAHDQADFFNPQSWSWNLYAYLLIGLCVVQLIPNKRSVWSVLSGMSVVALLIPIEKFQILKTGTSPFFDQMFIGDLDVNTTVGWGLFPWLALPVLGYCLGKLIRNSSESSWLFKGFKFELPMLLGFALALIFVMPFNPNISISTTGFYYYVFSGTLWFFWSRFLIIFIWMRLACLNSVNEYLGQFKWIRWLSSLAWNKHFGLCYFAQFAFLPWAVDWSNDFVVNPRLMDLFWIGLLIATELVVRLLVSRLKILGLLANKIASRA